MRIWSKEHLPRYGYEILGFAILYAVVGVFNSCDDGGYGRRAFAQAGAEARYGLSGGMALPDRQYTPGVVDPNAVADLSGKPHLVNGIERNICAEDFRTGPIRQGIRNFAGLKKKACAEYGVAKCDASVEGDHLISIEIGGCPDCLTNIWPQPMAEARVKDHQVEDVLPGLVCAGKIALQDAQECVATDWVACGARIRQATETPEGPKVHLKSARWEASGRVGGCNPITASCGARTTALKSPGNRIVASGLTRPNRDF